MEYQHLKYNALHLQEELQWLSTVLAQRVAEVQAAPATMQDMPAPPVLTGQASVYSKFVAHYKLNAAERLMLVLALQPWLDPLLPERVVQQGGVVMLQFAWYGGVRSPRYQGVLPTGETVLFLLAGTQLEARIEAALLFAPAHRFAQKKWIYLQEAEHFEPDTAGVLSIAPELRHMLTSGTQWQPPFNPHFPARQVTTRYSWQDLVLNPETEQALLEMMDWMEYRSTLLKALGFDKHSHSGYKALFYGPPGTGKSMAAAVLGKRFAMPVYRIDLSMVISKYIGETEKNLARIFDAAAGKEWILFFDEADALFGKRTQVQSANDRFANQEVSYLLMRMEEYEGIAILATNLKGNIDKAFLRRFQLLVPFMLPAPEQRLRLWTAVWPKGIAVDPAADMGQIAKQYALTGANIVGVARYCCTRALKQKTKQVQQDWLLEGIRRELTKEAGMAGD